VKPATVLWHNADIVTLDPAIPRAQALVSEGEVLVYVGDEAGARRRASGAPAVDLGGHTVVPGFNDNHLHLVIHGDHTYAPDLTGLDEAAIVDRMRGFGALSPGEGLLVAYGWDYPACPHPTKELLDEAFPTRPVALAQFGGHGLWVNSLVLASLGIDQFHGPAEGQVVRDGDGHPTGILLELGSDSPVGAHFRAIFFDKAEREPRIRRALDEYRRRGITSVQDNSWYHPVVLTLAKFRRQKTLTARVSCWSYGREPNTLALMNLAPYDADWVRKGPRKYFLDGTFTTRTAWMTEAYPGRPNDHGMGFEPAWLEAILERLVRQSKQGAFHSIGDQSTATFLDVWQKVVNRHPGARDLRMRLEHGQVIRPEDIGRLRDLGVCIAAQPPALASPEKDIDILGRDRATACYPHRSLLDAGVALSFGSDIPGEGFCDPLRGMNLVCNREGPERIEPLEALRAYTQGSAYVEFEEHRKGTLQAGCLADFTVLTTDPTTREGLGSAEVVRTVVGGTTVFTAGTSDGKPRSR
jgi:predicted amidohydrolase YtcJ